jgi:hypothetical protein
MVSVLLNSGIRSYQVFLDDKGTTIDIPKCPSLTWYMSSNITKIAHGTILPKQFECSLDLCWKVRSFLGGADETYKQKRLTW